VSISIRDPRFTRVVGPGVNFERIATGLPLHRGSAVASAGAVSALERHAGDHSVVGRPRRRQHLSQAVQHVERAHLGSARASARLRHASSQITRTEPTAVSPARDPLQGKRAQQPERHRRAPTDSGIYFSDRRMAGEILRVRASRNCRSRACTGTGVDPKSPLLLVDDFDRPTVSAFRWMDGACSSTTPPGSTSASSM
jgi:hypothetical protein